MNIRFVFMYIVDPVKNMLAGTIIMKAHFSLIALPGRPSGLVDMATSQPFSSVPSSARRSNGNITSLHTTACTSQAPTVTPGKRSLQRIYRPAKNSLYDILQ